MTTEEISSWAQAHPYLTAALVAYVLLSAFANARLSEETAARYPRLASAWIVAQKWGLVARGVIKPLVGIFLPPAAKEVVSQIFPPSMAPPPPTPRNTEEEHPS